ncbi:SET and MYND domain-containing protein 4-like [Aphidius gifuensis]|uniref:SET and MYND domain-containing protein 4-like n=1 Tax=Aphidius gifuensis TaxID=684658 RepID=UPI001CDD7C40|nr:SET and MYND domain-containing protein 4-like [Aphidius gifuensis]
MNTLESEIKRRERVNIHAILWKAKLEAALTAGLFSKRRNRPSWFRPKKLNIDQDVQLFPTITINSKDAILSELYKKVGDLYFQDGEYMMAHKRYTQCITQCPTGSHLLAFGYAARSIALFYGNFMSDCLIDIERAIQHGYPDGLKSELYMWKASAMKELKMERKLIKKTVDQARGWLVNIADDQLRIHMKNRIDSLNLLKTDKLNCFSLDFQDAALPSLKSRNPTVPGLSNSVGLEYSKKHGRHVVATQDIKAGDVIGIQKPYASVVKMNVKYNVCWHCKKQTWTSIPCDTCSQVIFCSDDCKKQAQDNYHAIECLVLCQAMAFGVRECVYTALRLVIMALKQSNNSFEKLMETVHEIDNPTDPLTKGFIEGKLDPTKFESVYGLCDLSPLSYSSRTAKQRYSSLADAIILSYFLGKKIEYFQEDCTIDLLTLVTSQKYSDLITIANKFMNVTQFNAFNYTLLSSHSGGPVLMASSIIPSMSFFNHSCCPNVIRTYRDGNLALIAIRPIKKDEQVFIKYGAYWFFLNRKARHELLGRYQFTCDCEACERDWCLADDLITAPAMLENKSFTHGGPYMSKDILATITKYVKACKTAVHHAQTSNEPYPIARIVSEFTTFLNKEYENYCNGSHEVFRVGKFIEDLYLLSQKCFSFLPGETDYPALE